MDSIAPALTHPTLDSAQPVCDDHRLVQQRIKLVARKAGFKVMHERHGLGGPCSVDVSLAHAKTRVAIEVAATARASQNSDSIRECLEAPFSHVIVVSTRRAFLSLAQTSLNSYPGVAGNPRLSFMLLVDLESWLTQFQHATPIRSTRPSYNDVLTKRRGYTVRTRFVQKPSAEVSRIEHEAIRAVIEGIRKQRLLEKN